MLASAEEPEWHMNSYVRRLRERNDFVPNEKCFCFPSN
jgi:hypothetical protein